MICIFKCPGCDSNMTFSVEKQKLVCDVCGKEISVDEYDAGEITLDGGTKCGSDTSSYVCPTCGAEMLTGAEQATCTCSYCGTGMAVFGSGEGKLSPEKIIPFSIRKEQAEAHFKQWWMEHDTMPEFDMNKMKLELHPVYLPVWLLNATAHTDMSAVVNRTENIDEIKYDFNVGDMPLLPGGEYKGAIGRLSDKQRVEKRYLIRKAVDSKFDKVPNNASYHFSSTRFEGIEPYNYDFLEDFTPAYLSGFPAEQYSIKVGDVVPRTISRVKRFGEEQCRTYILGSGAGVSRIETDMGCIGTVELQEACYALVPVWICSYVYQKKRHSVYVNGQTGKTDGEVLVIEKRTLTDYLVLMLATFWLYFSVLLLLYPFLALSGRLLPMVVTTILLMIAETISFGKGSPLRQQENNMKGFELFSDIEYVKKDSKDPKKVLWRSLIIGTVAFVLAMGSYSVFHSALRYKMSGVLPELLGVSAVAAAVWSVFFMSRHVKEQAQQEKAEYTDYLRASQSIIKESSEQRL
ncbi:MAG: hypothetical protein ACI4DW_10280 [Lachnospiraceae bacterium]